MPEACVGRVITMDAQAHAGYVVGAFEALRDKDAAAGMAAMEGAK